MADKHGDAELPHRVRGAARTVPLSPVSPVAPTLSEELRQRMQAAVQAERAEAAAHERDRPAGTRTIEMPRQISATESAADKAPGPESSAPTNGSTRKRAGVAAVESAARPGSAAGDEVTEWLRSAIKARAATEPGSAVRPGPAKRRTGARLVALGLALIVIGLLATVAVKHFSRAPASQAAVRAQAAGWVAGQVSPDITVSCDAAMCAALKADGYPAGRLVVLEPTSPDPVPSVLVVDTPTVREMFGSSLAIAWAPAVLASFGSGAGAIAVRVVAPHGATAYQTSLNADLAGREAAGAALLRDSRVTVSATALGQLIAGQVDSRLLSALASLAGRQPVDIVRFGNLGQGASPGVPLRFADLAENVPAAHLDTAAYVSAVWAVLSGADARIRPARAVLGPVQGQAILRVEFTAPSPLG